MGKRLSIALALLPLALAPGLAGAESSARDGGATSQAYALKVIVPGQGGASTTAVTAPVDAVSFGNAGAYPSADVVSWGGSVASASASPGQTATANAAAEVSSLTLFGGEVQATGIKGAVQSRASVGAASGEFTGSAIGSLTVLGQAVGIAPNARVALGDWGTAILLAQGSSPAPTSYRGNVTALDIRITVDHGGLPAGTQILVGYAEAAVTSPEAPTTTGTTTGAVPTAKPPKGAKSPEPPEQNGIPPVIKQPPIGVKPKLTPGRYVFPVYGQSSFTNTFGAPRADTGWHHGEDIFSSLGAPLLAVSDATVFSVGWNDVGGYRLWLRDRQGNQFYYAHLSAFSPLAQNGIPPVIKQPPIGVKPKLTPGRYVFPVYGQSSFTNTFGAPRADTGWHHGEDIFSSLGAPLLAVSDGTVFSVGWNDVGGYRLWLRDRQGNQFYYAHLSAFSPLAQNGAEVKAGDVLGFMGNSGDAQGTPYHLHFEIHPLGMLHMGYDGVVAPYPYLVAWRRVQDIVFPDGAGWAPPAVAGSSAPKPGAIVLQVSDISTASGLRPGSLARAFVAPVSAEGDGSLLRGFASPSAGDGAREGGGGDQR